MWFSQTAAIHAHWVQIRCQTLVHGAYMCADLAALACGVSYSEKCGKVADSQEDDWHLMIGVLDTVWVLISTQLTGHAANQPYS
jgi:hypothetical protein